MAEMQQRTSSKDAGSATGFSSKAQRDLGASDVQGVNLKINQADFIADLDALIGVGRELTGCSIGQMVNQLDEPLRNKLNAIFKNEKVISSSLAELMKSYGLAVSSSDVLRRHRRRLLGKDGCKCPIES